MQKPIKQDTLPPLVHTVAVPEGKGMFHEHKVLIVSLAVIIVITVVIILVYYFSKRDVPQGQLQQQRAKLLEERKAEEKKLDVEEMKEREKIRKLNAARRTTVPGNDSVGQSNTNRPLPTIREEPQEGMRQHQQYTPQHTLQQFTPQEQKMAVRVDNPNPAANMPQNAEHKRSEQIADSVDISDIISSNTLTEMQPDNHLEQHQRANIVDSTVAAQQHGLTKS